MGMATLLATCSLAGDWTRWRVVCKAASCDPHRRHTTHGRTPLDEWSGRRSDFNLTTHNTHKRQISTPPAASEHAIPASERAQTHTLGYGHTASVFDRYFTLAYTADIGRKKQMRLNKWKRSQWCRAALTCTDMFRRLTVETKSFFPPHPCMPVCRVVPYWTHHCLVCIFKSSLE